MFPIKTGFKPITEKDLVDLANPCMKCGSVQCAICYNDLKSLFEKQNSDLKQRLLENIAILQYKRFPDWPARLQTEYSEWCEERRPQGEHWQNVQQFVCERLLLMSKACDKEERPPEERGLDITLCETYESNYVPYDGKSLEGAGTKTNEDKKYPSCTAPVGRFCNKHQLVHKEEKKSYEVEKK